MAGFNWGEALKWMVPAGITAGGAILSNRSQNQQNQRLDERTAAMDQMAKDQMNRQNAYSNLVLPSLLQALGRKDPKLLQGVAASGGAPPGVAGPSGGGASPSMTPPTGGLAQPGRSNAGTIGDISSGASIGTLAAGPIGGAVGAAVGGLSNLFGGGRRAANPWTQTTQNDFGQQVSGIIDPYNQAKNAGSLTPEATTKAQDDFRRLLAQYTTSANQYAGTGNQQKRVIDQMWNQFNGPGYIPDWKKTLGIGD